MGIYTIFFLIWLIWLFVLRFRHFGQVCAGKYLEANDSTIGYATVLGTQVSNLIISVLVMNVSIGIIAGIAGALEKNYVKKELALLDLL